MRSRRAAILWGAAIAYAAAIFVLSSQPVSAPAEETVALLGDKALHGIEYAGFAILLTLAISSTPSTRVSSRAAMIAFAGTALYAASDEFHQTLVPGRDGNLADLAADVLGAFVGAALVHAWRRRSARATSVSETSPR